MTVKDDLKSLVTYRANRYKSAESLDGYTNMRSDPSSGEAVKVEAGSEVQILEQGSKYSKIKYGGKEGYVPNRYVEKK